MKALIRKELRENLAVGVLGFLVASLGLMFLYYGHARAFSRLPLGQSYSRGDGLQPLLASEIFVPVAFFCAIAGALLGWLQIRRESPRDLWAFLVHRPMTRTEIFLSKTIAGMVWYCAALGVPLACLIGWVAIPGNVPVPFDWRMALPLVGWFLAGIAFYFAGLLTGLRQARWYASRGLGLGLAFIVALGVGGLPESWQAFLILIAGISILATAAWGAFQTDGWFRGQPLPARAALSVVIAAGCVVIVFVAMAVSFNFIDRADFGYASYRVGKDGRVYQIRRDPGGPERVLDVDGKPVLNPATGRLLTRKEFNADALPYHAVFPVFEDGPVPRFPYASSRRFFEVQCLTRDALWFWDARDGTVVAYDVVSRRRSAVLRPADAGAGDPAGGFHRGNESYLAASDDVSRTFATDSRVYAIDFNRRSVAVLMEAPPGDHVGGTRDLKASTALVVTRRSVYLIEETHPEPLSIPYEPGYPEYGMINFAFLGTNRYVCWFEASFDERTNRPHMHIKWVTREAGVTNSINLPRLSQPKADRWDDFIAAVGIPPVVFGVLFFFEEWEMSAAAGWLAVAAAAGCVGGGWWLGWRHQFTPGQQLSWGVFHVVFGLAGLLAFLCLQEWPRKERCRGCGKLRSVEREDCEHCGKEFARPEPDGTEIFEPLVTPGR